MAAITLQQLVEQALSKLGQLTFNISDVETVTHTKSGKPISTGNVGLKVKTSEGKVITFWSSNMDSVVEPTDNKGNYRVIPGTRLNPETDSDGNPTLGLIQKDATKGGIS